MNAGEETNTTSSDAQGGAKRVETEPISSISMAMTTPVKAEEKSKDREISSSSKVALGSGQKFGGDDASVASSSTMGYGGLAGGKDDDSSTISFSSPSGGDNRLRLARPHHIPKLDSLSKRLDEIRKTMGDQVNYY